MARQKKKTCLYCYAPLSGRRDAKTCSARCRKRLQRARLLLEQDLEQKFVSEKTARYGIARTRIAERVAG
jgi:hypothetical protein